MTSSIKKWTNGIFVFLLLQNLGCTTSQPSQNAASAEFPESFTVAVANPLARERESVLVLIREEELPRKQAAFNRNAFIVTDGTTEIPSQYNGQDQENRGIALVLDQMAAGETRKLTVQYHPAGANPRTYPKRTQAELSKKVGGAWDKRKYVGGTFQNIDSLRVPSELTDHSYYLRYEGPGWESDKVGYRFYLDWRNAVDVFGKKTPEMVLQKVGLDGYDSYHNPQPWGMDVLKVGKALGVGTLAMYDNGKAVRVEKTDSTYSKINQNGPVYSSILTQYYGWQAAGHKLNVHSQLSIHAGTRMTHHQIRLEGGQPQNLATGLIKDKAAKLVSDPGEAGKRFGYMYTYGAQTLNKPADNIGIAVLFHSQDFNSFSDDPLSHVVQLKPTNGQASYYFLAAWELEPNGIKTEEQFRQYITRTAEELANPVKVTVSR
ncbi:DUF4861 domain-containing protein [Rufibacter sediminis]|uniref:DUF4861 domain-containing protein n=1 Tax=Rufibacter sediminis TaxID=2762756 RepID=A0ABR6VVF0_9BACT|nr:DUF4861 domain-containing protein [Rufibacter sediminis]MBC3541175.1 DUF4861 domain-containing protein [Rufibacter sediminis]